MLAIIAARCAAKRVPAKARLPSARAACLACAPLRLTDTSLPAQSLRLLRRPGSSLLQWGAGLLACAQRAAGLQLSCCAPGSSPAYYRCAGWMGLCPAGPAQGAPPPASPAPALPIPARHGPSFRFAPLTLSQSHNSTHIMLCAQIRGGLDEIRKIDRMAYIGPRLSELQIIPYIGHTYA